ncbi:Pfs1p NDAI_0C03510 [Naumovozyma dairenensis CBS 421]|uniref:Uncharacterized protein n=1 Tax=Naumovozyma dairenensis (strain ATCC 10597 / BCRC 20456 / CBS 421 / NBRC 0211 / NRRL Y-12639) TaxID=1071378 RepID=G0W8A0_NAUDC|nr:hypothetical protein NDAI_0C03510 [Naumovozyma dairenensis CBS 421]CCD24011.1 hypothetical protein NDAI_0C03510 [Naumovozyma dairenensis CBS 421]
MPPKKQSSHCNTLQTNEKILNIESSSNDDLPKTDHGIKRGRKFKRNIQKSPILETKNITELRIIREDTSDNEAIYIQQMQNEGSNNIFYPERSQQEVPSYNFVKESTNVHHANCYNGVTYFENKQYLNDISVGDYYNCSGETFPPWFNPRIVQNMSHKEKVNKWIEDIPIFEGGNGAWLSNCFDYDYSLDWEEEEFENFCKKSGVQISLVSQEDLLQLQSRKLDVLVRAFYEQEKEVANWDYNTSFPDKN